MTGTEIPPNDDQQELIDATEGTYLVDAGAGTGKTFTITRRYANILDREGIEPEDLLLLTFTNNAAEEMTDRIVAHCEYGMAALRDAPISTFHSLAHDILLRYGFEAPQILGIDDRITSTTHLLENEVIENERFREFVGRFVREHPEYEDYLRVLSDDASLLDLIKQLFRLDARGAHAAGSTAAPLAHRSSITDRARRSRRVPCARQPRAPRRA